MRSKSLSLLMAALLTSLAAAPALAVPGISAGREQLVLAFNAGWVQALNDGTIAAINAIPAFAGAPPPSTYVTNVSDCLPNVSVNPYPDKPKDRFAAILSSGIIVRATIAGGAPNVGDTASYFSGASQATLTAVLNKIGLHYATALTVSDIVIPPPFETTGVLVSTTQPQADFVDFVNALGGVTQNLSRRESRRFTCTMSASGQYIHVPAALAGTITSVAALQANTSLKICTGNLSTQLVRAYFPNHFVDTRFVNDIASCDARIALPVTNANHRDVYINSLPTLGIATAAGLTLLNTYTDVDTHIHAGTPLWVAREDVTCTGSYSDAIADNCVKGGAK